MNSWGTWLVSILIATHASAATSTHEEFEKAHQLAKNIEKSKDLVTQTEVKQRQILSHLFEINQKIKRISRDRSQLETEKRLVERSIEDLTEKITSIQSTLQTRGRQLINQVRLIHQTKDFAWLNVISGSQGPAETDLNLYIFNKLTSREKEKIVAYFEAKIQLQKSQEKLQARWSRLQRISTDLSTKEKDFLLRQQERKVALSEIKNEKSKMIQKIQKLRQTKLMQKLEDTGLLDGLMSASFVEEKGNLNLPAPGVLTHRFGIVKASESTYYKNHKGVFIQTKLQQPIQAVFEGKVAFVGRIGGFGETLILDHGDHYYTVYSSLAKADVREGQLISKNAIIGQVGASEFYSSPGFYFEIRHFSEPQDPVEWLKKGSL